MEKTTTTYYSINLTLPGDAPAMLSDQQERRELFLSANGKLVGLSGMGHFDSEELATEFLSAYAPRLEKRYGAQVQATVAAWSSIGSNKRLKARIAADSLLARQRLETGILASNMKP